MGYYRGKFCSSSPQHIAKPSETLSSVSQKPSETHTVAGTKNEAHKHLELLTGLWRPLNLYLKERMRKSYLSCSLCVQSHGIRN